VCWIVQSRPITTLGDATLNGTEDVWGNANLKDVIPGLVSPFTWSLMQPQLEGAMRQQYAKAGYLVPPERPLLRRFWGRPYFNISLFNEAGYALYGTTPELQAAQLGGMVPPGARPPASPALRQRLRWLRNILRFVRIANRAARVVPTQFAMVQQRWREERQSLPYLSRAALLEKLEHHADVTQPFLELHLHLSVPQSGGFVGALLLGVVFGGCGGLQSVAGLFRLFLRSGGGRFAVGQHLLHVGQTSRRAGRARFGSG